MSLFSLFKILLREQETKRALDDAEIKGMELEAQKRLFQQVSMCTTLLYVASGSLIVILSLTKFQ